MNTSEVINITPKPSTIFLKLFAKLRPYQRAAFRQYLLSAIKEPIKSMERIVDGHPKRFRELKDNPVVDDTILLAPLNDEHMLYGVTKPGEKYNPNNTLWHSGESYYQLIVRYINSPRTEKLAIISYLSELTTAEDYGISNIVTQIIGDESCLMSLRGRS